MLQENILCHCLCLLRSVKLRQIFDAVSISTGVYFFDEFDAIGADRGLDNEVGEARRILNSFLQFIVLQLIPIPKLIQNPLNSFQDII